MSQTESTPMTKWANDLESLSKKLHAHAKAILGSGDDPFAQRDQIASIDKTITELNLESLKAPISVRKAVETECVEASAEFWQRFSSAANDAGWDVHGTTHRRLVARAFFVEFKNDAVTIEGIAGKHTPYVPSLIGTLKPLIDSIAIDKASLQRFCDVLGEAYGVLGGQGEVSIEAVFRQCVLLAQPAGFWTNIDPSKFQPLSRPVFRSCLSAILTENMKPSDGREIRLMPTVNRKDVWELFSPAEGRVVQVGRIEFSKK